MSRYIDADALKEIIMDMRNHAEPSPCLPHQTMLIPDRMVCDKIDDMLTVGAVQVTRCGECTNRKYCEHPQKVDSDWFCADGERRTE